MVADYKKELLKSWEELPEIFITSGEKGTGRDDVLDYIETINKSCESSQSDENN